MAPALASEIRIELATLFAAFPRRADDDASLDVKLALYSAALDGYPAWAVSKAVKGYVKGHIGDRKWCPAPPAVSATCASYTALYEAAAQRIELALKIEIDEPPNAEERQRVKEGFRQLQSKIGAPETRAGHRTAEQERKAAEARLEELAASGPENTITLSESLRAKMGAM